MTAIIVALWLAAGLIIARLAYLEAERVGVRVAPLWWAGLVLLGPATALAVLVVGETASLLEEVAR